MKPIHIVLLLVVSLVLLGCNPTSTALADGTTGRLITKTTDIFLNSVVIIEANSMEDNESYSLEVNDIMTDSWDNYTTRIFHKSFDSSDVSNDQIKVELVSGSVVDVIYFSVFRPNKTINQLISTLIVPICLVGILFIVLGIVLSKVKEKMG